jgi:hypothetical protein
MQRDYRLYEAGVNPNCRFDLSLFSIYDISALDLHPEVTPEFQNHSHIRIGGIPKYLGARGLPSRPGLKGGARRGFHGTEDREA